MTDHSQTATALDWVAASGTLVSVLLGVAIVAGTFWRRPNLSLLSRRAEWQVERNAGNAPIPCVRLVARNGRLHRAARGARVLAENYHRSGNAERIPLGSVSLGWTSAADAIDGAVVIFPDGER